MKRSLIIGARLLVVLTAFSIARAADVQPTSAETPDLADFIIYNAKVLTVNSNFTVASAIAVRDGRILAVGKDRKLEEYRGPETRMVDAQGRVVMPGLYDADVHSYAAAVSELKGPVPAIDSISDAQAYIRKQATNKPAGAWIVLNHIYPTQLKEGRLPTKEELDAATTNHPVYWDFGPMAVVNSKALEVSKIDKDTQAPAGGELVKEPRHFKLTGLLRNSSSLLKLPAADRPPTAAQERAALKHLYQHYNEQGITSIGEIDTTPAEIDLFRDMSRSNELTVRINCERMFTPSNDVDESNDRLDAMTNVVAGKLPYGPTGAGDDWVKIGPLKLTVDGDLNTGTAYLRTPYGIGPTYMISELAYRGVLKQNGFVLPQVELEAARDGWQLATHCSGDAALDFALNGYEQVQFKMDIRERRFLLKHTDFAAAQDWRRCEALGLGVVLTPGTLYEQGASLEKTLGTNRMTYFVPLKGWFNRNIVAGGGSGHEAGLDSLKAATPWNPWLGMWVTLTRKTKQGVEMNPAEQLTREQAVRFYTANNAWMHFEDNVKGSLEPGKVADLVMLDTDILKCPVDEIRNTKVLMTMVNGKVVWQAVEPIFPGPQVIQAVTINSQNQPVNVAAPVSATAAPAAVKSTAGVNAGINPYAPVTDATAAPVAVAPVSTAPANAAAPVSTANTTTAPAVTTVQPAAITTSNANATATASIPAVPVTPTASVAPVIETTTAKSNYDAKFSPIAGAAPAEVGSTAATAALTPASSTAAATNQAPTAPVLNSAPATATNQVPSALGTNAANSVVETNQVAATQPATAPVAAAATPVSNVTTTETAAAAVSSQTPAEGPSSTTQVAAATTPASSTTTSTTTTNDAGGAQDWSRVNSQGTK